MRYEFRKQNIWIIRIRTVQLQLRLLYFTPLIKNRFKISGYCFLLIIPPIFTPLFITRMNCFDHLNTEKFIVFYQNVFIKGFYGKHSFIVVTFVKLMIWKILLFSIEKMCLSHTSLLLHAVTLNEAIHITTATGNNAVRIYYSTNNIYRIDSLT